MAKPDGRCGKRDDWSRVSVMCPFYRSENRSKIRCSGFENVSALNATFPTPAEKRKYQQKFCDNDWRECPIAKVLAVEKK